MVRFIHPFFNHSAILHYIPRHRGTFFTQDTTPEDVGWQMLDNPGSDFVDHLGYTDPDIICHKGAVAPLGLMEVTPGCTITILWSEWPENHKGPILDYLAPCGDGKACKDVPKEQLRFSKIHEAGIIEDSVPGSSAQGKWYTDELRANNMTWPVTIPKVKPGEYTLRTEIISLHGNDKVNGAQHYPMCFTIKINGGETRELTGGVLGTQMYNIEQPGIHIDMNIYRPQNVPGQYPFPGPPLWTPDGASSGSSGGGSSVQTSASASASSPSTQARIVNATPSMSSLGSTTSTAAVTSPSASASSSSLPYANTNANEGCGPASTVTSLITVTATPSAVSWHSLFHLRTSFFFPLSVDDHRLCWHDTLSRP